LDRKIAKLGAGKMKKVLRSFLAFALILSLSLSRIFAAGASLYFYPSSGTQYVDNYFPVYVYVNTGGNETNAYKAIVTYPTDKLWITSVSSGGSICTLSIPPSPSYSNSQGRATFECGTPTAYNGSVGRIGTITFLVKETGTATLRIASGSQVKKADGKGTEILAIKGTATFTLKPPPTGAPAISSPTHPDQNAWYQATTAILSWTKPSGADGFSFTLTHSSKTVPDDVSEGTETSKTYKDLTDGVWYFHLKAHSSGGWSAVRHFRIQIDTQAPDEFEIVSDPPADKVIDRAPTLSFATTDKPSEIDHYEISIDGSDFERTTSPYRFDWIYSGTHEVTVRAVDKAGNTRDASITLRVKHVPPPTITSPKQGEILPLFEPLVIQGKVVEAGTVELFLDDRLLTSIEVTGPDFEYTYTEFLHPWQHRLSATFITEEGIKSAQAEVSFRVDPRAITLFGITFPGWLIYGLLIIIIIHLLLLLIRYLRSSRQQCRETDEEVEKIKRNLEKDLDKMEENLERTVEKTLQDGDERKLRGMEHYLRKRIKEADTEMRKDLREKLDRIRCHPTRRRRRPLQLFSRLLSRLRKKH